MLFVLLQCSITNISCMQREREGSRNMQAIRIFCHFYSVYVCVSALRALPYSQKGWLTSPFTALFVSDISKTLQNNWLCHIQQKKYHHPRLHLLLYFPLNRLFGLSSLHDSTVLSLMFKILTHHTLSFQGTFKKCRCKIM